MVPAVVVVFGYPTEQQRERVKPPRFSVEEVVGENTYLRKSGEEFLGMLDFIKEAKLFRDVISDYKEIGQLIKDEKTDTCIIICTDAFRLRRNK